MFTGTIPWRARILIAALTLVIVAGLVAGVTIIKNRYASSSAATLSSIQQASATVTIPRGQDQFVPFILPVTVNTVVTWVNNDSVAHVFSTTPQHSTFLNPQAFSFNDTVGGGVIFQFTRPGIYHYYETTKGTWNVTFSRVTAHTGLRHYPLSMEGIIWVQGAIAGLPLAALNFILAGHDMFASEFLAIAASGAVTWHNLDTEPHFVGLVDGWSAPINPVDIGLYRIAGTNDVVGGQSVTVLFTKPGLYYYYCRNHDQEDPRTNRAGALLMASEYPIPMEGFVLVV